MGTSHSALRQMITDQQAHLRSQDRMLSREIFRSERERAKTYDQMKSHAQVGSTGTLKTLSKQYIVQNKNIENLHQMKLYLSTVSNQIQLMQSRAEIFKIMQKTTFLMHHLHKQMGGIGEISNSLREFEHMNTEGEMIQDELSMFTDVGVGAADDDEADALAQQVMDEVSIQKFADDNIIPSHTKSDEQQLQNRLNNLN